MTEILEKLPQIIMDRTEQSIGKILLEMGKIHAADVPKVAEFQKAKGLLFGEAALQLGLITNADIEQVLSRQFQYPYLSRGHGSFPKELVAAYSPFTRQVEALRTVRSQLMNRWFGRGHKSLPIIGIGAGDGTSMFIANLAVIFSQLGQRSLVVDADLRSPSMNNIFKLQRKSGLSDLLVGRGQDIEATVVEHFVSLSVLSAGTIPPNPQELLSRPTFKAVTQKLEQSYDCIFFDTTPMSKAGDALEVAAAMGCALFLVRKHHTKISELEYARNQFQASGIEIVGIVMIEF